MKIVLGVFVLAVVGFIGLIVVQSRQKAAAHAADPLVTSIASCQTFVKAALKAPATAVFVEGASAVRIADSDQIRVVGSVDAQNSFGALVRNDYECVVAPAPVVGWRLDEDLKLTAR